MQNTITVSDLVLPGIQIFGGAGPNEPGPDMNQSAKYWADTDQSRTSQLIVSYRTLALNRDSSLKTMPIVDGDPTASFCREFGLTAVPYFTAYAILGKHAAKPNVAYSHIVDPVVMKWIDNTRLGLPMMPIPDGYAWMTGPTPFQPWQIVNMQWWREQHAPAGTQAPTDSGALARIEAKLDKLIGYFEGLR